MAGTTVVFGALLIVLGLGGYFGTGRHSATALIPAAFGVVFVLLGWIARNARLRMHAMHLAALVSLIGLVATVWRGIIPLAKWLTGTPPAKPAAIIAQSVMAALLLIYLVMCVKSFIDVRVRRRLPPSETAAVNPPTSRG